MNTTHATRSTTTRGTIIKVPDATAGIVFVSGQQRPFTIPGIWRSPVAPAPNMTVEVELDAAGSVAALTAVARPGLGGLVARMLGTRRLPAMLVICGFAWHSTLAQTPQVETQTIAGVQPNQAEISPRGAHVAAAVLRGSRSVMTWDGVDGPRFDEIVSIPNMFLVGSTPAQVISRTSQPARVVFSPDGEHFIYAARAGQEFVVMADGKEVGRGPWATDALAGWGFSPSGKHFYYVVHKRGAPRETYELMYDGKAEPASHEVFHIIFSPDGEHHAYVQQINPPSGRPAMALLLNGKPAGYPPAGQQILWDDNTAPLFTADGLHFFVQASSTTPGATEVFADGKPLIRANAVKLFAMPTGSGFVAVVTQTNGPNAEPLSFATAGSRKIPGSDCPGYVAINGVFLSADGKHAAIRCQAAPTQQWMMTDGKKGLEYQNITDAVFTADGRAVYVASSNGKQFVVIGDAESDGYSMIPPPASTQTGGRGLPPPVLVAGNHVGWMAGSLPGSNDQAVVVDGKTVIRRGAGNLELSPDGSRFALTFGPGQLSSANIDGIDEKGATVHPYFRAPSSKPQPPQGFFKFSPDSKHVVHFGRAGATNTYGLFIDGKFLAVPGVNARCLSFTPDSRHLIWLDTVQGSTAVFVDGVVAGQLDQTGVPMPDSWDVGADGTVTYVYLTAAGDVKRVRIRPSAATSIDTMLARAK